jgi:signal transduction histidine kinase
MFDVFSIAVMISIITFTIWLISIRIRDYRKAEINKMFSLGKVNVLKNGFVLNFIFFFVYLGIFFYKSKEVYEILNPKYLDNIFQMFSIRHLEYLETTFYEKELLSAYFRVSRFRNEFLILLMTIVVEFCIFLYRYSLTKIENIIYSDGLLLNGKLIPWQTIKSYQWEEKKSFFNNKPVKTLTIKSNTESSFTFASKQSIDLSIENERMVNHYLKRYSIESKNIA